MEKDEDSEIKAHLDRYDSKPLDDLCQIINKVLVPLERKDNIKRNLLNFQNNVKNSLDQLKQNFTLQQPFDLPNESNEQIARDITVIRKLDAIVDQWIIILTKAHESLTNYPKNITSAIMEIDNRKRSVANWSILAQQLRSENIQRLMNILDLSDDSTKKQIFRTKVTEFEKIYEDASDYLKFLQTLERSIKDLSNDDLATISHSISGIFHNLKIIWMISKHKDPNKFGFLLEIMSKEICAKISDKIKLKEIFSDNPDEIDSSIALIDQAMQVATKWHTTYGEARNKTKWEYSHQKITNDTEYIAKTCKLLRDGLKKIKGFQKFLGHDLERVRGGSSDRIEKEKEKVRTAYSHIQNYPWNIFDKENYRSCDEAFVKFESDMKKLENDTKKLIDETFDNLKNAESAFELYRNFDTLIDQEDIKKAMRDKYINILERFIQEVRTYGAIFEKNKDNPPISKAKSEVAGKIAWARLLYVKMKRPISKIFKGKGKLFKKEPEDSKEKTEQQLASEYLEVSRKLKNFEAEIFERWKSDCLENFMTYLRDNILRKKDKFYEVNFDIKLKLMIKNTKFLDLYGFSEIPPNIINIAHQEAQLAKYCNMLNLMLKDYDSLLKTMKPHHHLLLSKDSKDLVTKIEVGIQTHNWTALGIEEFYRECQFGIKVLRDKFTNVIKSEEKITNILNQIANATLVKEFDSSKNANRELGQFLSYYNDHLDKVILELQNKFQEITLILIDIERLTFEIVKDDTTSTVGGNNNNGSTSTQVALKGPSGTAGRNIDKLGERVELKEYYTYWEKYLLNSLTKAVLKAMITLNELLSLNSKQDKNTLFTVKSKFISSKEILYNPNANEIDRELKSKFIILFQTTGQNFVRWMDETCKVPPTLDFIEDVDRDYIKLKYSYGTEMADNTDIKHYINQLYQIISKIVKSIEDNKQKYTLEYGQDYFGHWGQNVKAKMEKELEKNKTLKNFEKKISTILFNLEEFRRKREPRRICAGNFTINNEELINKGCEQIRKVTNDMLKILDSELKTDLSNFNKKIESFKQKLKEQTTTSDELKKVLGNVAVILNKKLYMELKIHDMAEKIHFLKIHNYPDLNETIKDFEKAKKEWDNLRVKAKKKDENLRERKKNLAITTEMEAENLKRLVLQEYQRYKEKGPSTNVELEVGYNLLQDSNETLKILKQKKEEIVGSQKLFNLPITTFPEINEMSDTNAKIEPIYNCYHNFDIFYNEQLDKAWEKVEVSLLEKKNDDLILAIREFKSKQLTGFFPYKHLEDIKDKYQENLRDIIIPLKSPVINERNMKEFFKEICPGRINLNFKSTTLREILKLDLIKDKDKVISAVKDAQGESDVKEKLDEIKRVLEEMKFQMLPHRRGDSTSYKIKDVTEENEKIKDNIQILQQYGPTKHANAFKQEISELELEMNLIMEIIEIWVEVQKKWIYLEAIFMGSEDIRQKLAKQTQDFEENDKNFKKLMTSVFKKPSIRVQCREKDRKFELKKFLLNFEIAEKSLTEHLDSKKNEFSRFYFLTEQDLLQILGSSDPLQTLNPHMIKIYENCKELLSDRRNIIGMRSSEDERFIFDKPVRIESQQQVGAWMNKVDEEMKSTLRYLTKMGIQDYTKEDLYKFVHNKLGMICVNTIECWWTFALEDVFRRVRAGDKYAMKKELERQIKGLMDLVSIMRKKDIQPEDALKVTNLIIRTVHGKDIVDKFVRDSILDVREFEWESQLKFSWDKQKDDLVIRQCNGTFHSCYEYQGLQYRLVITPLTDRCVMTLTTALTFFLGGSPAGPAGTGKTETVKDLGKGLGIRVVVQNCSDTLDYLFMGQFFSGLSQTGFWGCFDEFNMINREVLSVVTTQIRGIQSQLALGNTSWILIAKEVKEIKLLPTIGIFITMNPNYEGRSELPDNLKALFRPVTMVTPDYLLICENILLSYGFAEGKKLACKIDKLYELSKEQLSKQHHYEWGLRSMKAVLSSAGKLKRDALDMKEDLILMKAMKDINMPKFIKDDAILFEGLLKDLFPDLDSSELKEDFQIVVKNAIKELKYDVLEGQVNKVLQMHEVMNIRHCTMICGPPMSGKSCILEILKKSNEELKKTNTVTYLINPKAQTIPRLFGKKNEISDDFEIGIFSNIFINANAPIQNNKAETRWIIFDGDVDPFWIEKLNSVMDDSKQLTLENKDRIKMQPYCSLLVESYNMQHASPATISRLGMIYVDNSLLKGYSVFYRWLESKDKKDWDETLRGYLYDNYRKFAAPCIKYVLKGARGNEEEGIPLKMIINQYEASMVNQLCAMLDSFLTGIANPPSEVTQIESLFIFCLIWSIGACVTAEDREKLTKFVTNLPEKASNPPSKLYDNFWDLTGGRFLDWDNEFQRNVTSEADLRNLKYNEIMIPTGDSKKYSWMLKQLISIKKPVLFVGDSGTGKTITIQHYLKVLTKERKNAYLILSMNFSSRTTSMDFQNTMEEILETRFLRTMGPPSGKELIIYVDDLGMPKVDKFETQQPIAFLKLLIEKKCYYHRENKDLIRVLDTNFVGSTLPPGGGNNPIDPRFVALFSVFNITIEQSAVEKIFEVILRHYLSAYPEDNENKTIDEKLIKATLQLFSGIREKLTRSPVKFHYVFNIRDISKIFQGFCQFNPDKYQTKESLIKLWRHECLRVFADKLRESSDKKIVDGLINDTVMQNFQEQAEYVLDPICLHADFMKVNFYDDEVDPVTKLRKPDIRFYEHVPDYESLKTFFGTALDAYKDFNQQMDLVFYDDCVDHLIRIHRILRLPHGNALLIGIGGSGKSSLSKLATFIARYELWMVKITSKFEEKHLREQLLELFRKFNEDGELRPVSFLFTDEQVLDEGFLELINNILTTGIVPAIFEKVEKDAIIEKYKAEAIKQNLPESKDVAYGLFVKRVKENLHMIIAMSPSGDKLRNRCNNFPGFVSSTTIDWFFEWPREALLQVSRFMLSNYKNVLDDLKPTLCEHIIEVHLSVRTFSNEALSSQKRYIYTTPKNFLDYIKKFQDLYHQNFNKIRGTIGHLEKGLQALLDAATNIEILKTTVEAEESKATESAIELESLIKELNESSQECEKKTNEAVEQEKFLTQRRNEIEKEQISIERNVEEITVIVEAISKEVEKIDPQAVDMNARMTKFEGDNGTIIKAVVFSLKENTTSWGNFTDNEITNKISKTTTLIWALKKVSESFDNIKNSGGSIAQTDIAYNKVKDIKVKENNLVLQQLQRWVINFHHFCQKNQELLDAQENLQKKINEKNIAEASLAETQETLKELKERRENLTKEKNEKEIIYDETTKQLSFLRERLSTARELFQGLKSEETRWSLDKSILAQNSERLIGDCLLGAAFLSYCGPFAFDFRRRMIYDTWKADIMTKGILVSENFTVQNLLTTELQISQWNLEGLPDDELSIQNGILTDNAQRWPLCIDPEMQGITWIKKRGGDFMKTISFNMENYMKTVIFKIRGGGTVLIENVSDTIDPNINPVLEKNYRIKSGIVYITLDGTEMPVHDTFKLFMITKLSNPHYSPEIMAKTIVINFSITMDGLEEQLLNEVVRFEYPENEETRKKLVDEMNANKITLKNCENALLDALNASAGTDILKNTALIETLKQTKQKAKEVKMLLDRSEKTKKDIYTQRDNYKPAAKRGSILYFAISGLRLLSSMYEYSLSSYMQVYVKALQEAPKDPILNNRLESIKKKLTTLIYEYICLSIFDKHKLMFSFHMRTMIMKYEEEFNSSELSFFLKGNLLEARTKKSDDLYWLSDNSWQDLDGIGSVNDVFRPLIRDFNAEKDEWKTWYDLEDPEDNPLPGGWDKKLSPLQKLLVIRVFRKDRVHNAIKSFIKHTTGGVDTYINPPPLRMPKIFEQSNEKTPILFIISPGVDPMFFINQFAIERGFSEKKFRWISLGQKQEVEAKNLIMEGIKRGCWILLQNCDLLQKWLKELENIIDEIETFKPKPDFRLWLTTSPIDTFPIGILHKSLKVVTEPPDGLSANMNRIFTTVSQEEFETQSTHFAFKPLVYVLSFFHSVVQDRKKYGKIGWNVIYDFNESDFTVSRRLLALYLEKIGPDDTIPWSSLKYLIGEAMYGGRVTDDYDRRVMMTYLNEYMGDFIFDANQKFFFSRSEKHDYEIPEVGPHESYVKVIADIPSIYSPEIMGLHSNAEIDYFTQSSKFIWECMLTLQSSSGAGMSSKEKESGEKALSRDQVVLELAQELGKKLPPRFDMLQVNKKFPHKSPIEAVLVQEIERYNILNDKMKLTLENLIQSINGEIAMNTEIEEILISIYNGQLPVQWRKLAPETQKRLFNWMDHYLKRYIQYDSWLTNGEPKAMWLSGLHIPASYLKAIIQSTCRKKGWPLDKVSTYTVVSKITSEKDVREKPEFGCYIHGIYLEGAEWNIEKNCLEKQIPKKLLCEMPLIQIIPAEASKIKLRNNLKTPVYMTQNRNNIKGEGFVFEADLRTVEHPNTWILQGVALLLNTFYG